MAAVYIYTHMYIHTDIYVYVYIIHVTITRRRQFENGSCEITTIHTSCMGQNIKSSMLHQKKECLKKKTKNLRNKSLKMGHFEYLFRRFFVFFCHSKWVWQNITLVTKYPSSQRISRQTPNISTKKTKKKTRYSDNKITSFTKKNVQNNNNKKCGRVCVRVSNCIVECRI